MNVVTTSQSTAIHRSDYVDYFNSCMKEDNVKFAEQFQKIQTLSVEKEEEEGLTSRIGLQPDNLMLNRFQDIIPYDQRRVILGCRGPSCQEQRLGDYINASFMFHIPTGTAGPVRMDFGQVDYICTQAPMDVTCGDFWRMVVEQRVSTVVMLTPLTENGKSCCAQYWPQSVHSRAEYRSGDVQIAVELLGESESSGFVERTFHVYSSVEGRRWFVVRQLHVTSWPDADCPDMLQFEQLLNRYHQIKQTEEEMGPTVVHCRAGIGRSGTFIVADLLRQHLQSRDVYVDIPEIILQLRRCRKYMVETLAQYIHLHAYARMLIGN